MIAYAIDATDIYSIRHPGKSIGICEKINGSFGEPLSASSGPEEVIPQAIIHNVSVG